MFANADAADRASRGLAHAADRLKMELLRVRAAAYERLGEQDRERDDLLQLREMAVEHAD